MPPAEENLAAAQAALGEAPVTASGLGKSAVSGVRSGIEGVGGIGGDVAKGQRWLVKKLIGMLGATPETQKLVGDWQDTLNPLHYMPSSSDVGAATDAGVN